jgi:hypothetical protein
MNDAPEFIDNRDGNTLVEALAFLLGGSNAGMGEEAAARPADLAIAAAYFSPKGLSDLSPQLEGLGRVRLLFGVEASRRRAMSMSGGRIWASFRSILRRA